MALKILKPGLSTSIQDLGRPGYFHLGIPIGGAMDRFALRCANMLVGNSEDAAGLEAVFMGPEIEFTEDAVVAVCGADMPISVDGQAKTRNCAGSTEFRVLMAQFRTATWSCADKATRFQMRQTLPRRPHCSPLRE